MKNDTLPVQAEPDAVRKPERLVSLDAYRGFVMLAMATSGLAIARVVSDNPDLQPSPVWTTLAHQFSHVRWVGCTFWDLIQPSFMFIVGVAVPFSLAGRLAKGHSTLRIAAHTLFRAIVLVALGVFLASSGDSQTDFIFTNVLAQIGLAYCFVVLLAGRGWPVQLGAVAAILVGYWLFFYLYSVPPNFDYAAVNFAPGDDFQPFTGLFKHWNPNSNAAWQFDRWFLNLFPREEPFLFNRGSYATLNFIPSLVNMIIGLMAGELLIGPRETSDKVARLFVAGVFCLAIGWVAGEFLCPLVKRIWTPSFAVFSSGWTLILLAAAFLVIDGLRWRRWAFPLVVVGMNSITIYMLAQLSKGWIRSTLRTHLGLFKPAAASLFGVEYTPGEHIFEPLYGPIVESVLVVFVLWLLLFWMYRRKLFVRI